MKDLTCVYYTANHISGEFMANTLKQLKIAIGDMPVVSVSMKPMDLGKNICIGIIERSHLNIYRQALIGAKAAKTKYCAFVEDDVLYSKDHFKYIPKDNHFAYDMNIWSLQTYRKPYMFTHGDRINFNGLICERDLFIEAMEERFKKYPTGDSLDNLGKWSEPSKYEKQLGVTVRNRETYMPKTPSVTFYHPTAFSYLHLGTRKRAGNRPTDELPFWGKANKIRKLYYGS